MSTQNYFLILGITSFLFLFTSCSKKNSAISNKPEKELDSKIAKQEFELQVFDFDATTGGEIVGKLGTRLTFPPYAFQDISGFLIEGKIKLELKEFYVDTEESQHELLLRDDNKMLCDCTFELRAFEGKLPLVFLSSMNIAGLME